MGDNFGIHRTPAARGAAATEERTQGQILSDFLVQLEDYTPTVRLNLSILVSFSQKLFLAGSRCCYIPLPELQWI